MREKSDMGGSDGTSGKMERPDPVGVYPDRSADVGLGTDHPQESSGVDSEKDAF